MLRDTGREEEKRVNKRCAQCTWEKANIATTYKEAAEEFANCIWMQMLLASGFRRPPAREVGELVETPCGFAVRESAAVAQ